MATPAATAAATTGSSHAAPAATGADAIVDDFLSSVASTLLPNVASACGWSKKRDLPAMLIKPIVRPSAVIFHAQTMVAGLYADMRAGRSSEEKAPDGPMADASSLQQQQQQHQRAAFLAVVFHTALGLKESLLSVTPSRFHSRQMFVDVASLLTLMRSFARFLEQEASSPSPSEAFLLDQLNLVLVELAVATVVLHPSLVSLRQVETILRRWQHDWEATSASAAHHESVGEPHANGPTPRVDFTLLSRHLHALWDCAPFDPDHAGAAAASESTTRTDDGHRSPSASAFFTLPLLAAGTRSAAHAMSNAAFPSCITQDLPIDLECDAVVLLAGDASESAPASGASSDSVGARRPSAGNLFTRPIAPSSLLRIIGMRHEMREDDWPELGEEDETRAKAMRSKLKQLTAQYALQ